MLMEVLDTFVLSFGLLRWRQKYGRDWKEKVRRFFFLTLGCDCYLLAFARTIAVWRDFFGLWCCSGLLLACARTISLLARSCKRYSPACAVFGNRRAFGTFLLRETSLLHGSNRVRSTQPASATTTTTRSNNASLAVCDYVPSTMGQPQSKQQPHALKMA